MMTSFLLVVVFGISFAGNTTMVKYDTFAECDAARTAVIEAYDLDQNSGLLDQTKCIEFTWNSES